MHEARLEDAGLEVQGRGDGPYESGMRDPSRLAGLERDLAALEMFARVAAHELMAPLIAAETRARLLEDELHDRDDGRASADLQDLIRVLSRMHQLVETLLHDARSSGMPLERKPVMVISVASPLKNVANCETCPAAARAARREESACRVVEVAAAPRDHPAPRWRRRGRSGTSLCCSVGELPRAAFLAYVRSRALLAARAREHLEPDVRGPFVHAPPSSQPVHDQQSAARRRVGSGRA